MMRNDLIALPSNRSLGRSQALRLMSGYVVLYAFGWLAKPDFGVAPIWPAHAVSFAVYMLFPLRQWPSIALGICASELALVPLLHWATHVAQAPTSVTLGFALANMLTTAVPAVLARFFGLFRREDRLQLVVSPLWIFVLFVGVGPGAFVGAATNAYLRGTAVLPADIGLWVFASVLTLVTFGPTVFCIIRGVAGEARAPARAWEGWAVSALVSVLFIWFFLVPWPAADELVEPMLFTVPLIWLALRFSHRTTSIAVAIVASGVAILAAHGMGIPFAAANAAGWRDIVIAIDMFLLIGCGGALLINVMTLKQRALLEELEREHKQLRQYAQALDFAEEAARRATAADLHDGIGQVLAGQSMTLAAMRAHANQPRLAALVEEAIEASREAQEGLRLMIQDLSPPELEQASLDQTLKWLVDLFKTRFGFTVTYRVAGGMDLRRDQLHLVYRCIRELLMNACKHSRRQSAEVEVEVTAKSVDIAVIDEGVGFDIHTDEPTSGRRFGLAQLRERVRAAGGALNIETVAGEGCRVTVRLPA
jgi:signal transduction histidine kinase